MGVPANAADAVAVPRPGSFRSDETYAGVTLPFLIGPGDARFPKPEREPLVLDLTLSPEEFIQWGRRPASDWWPVLETIRARGWFLRVPLAAKGSTVSALRRLARLEPKARFLVDPFLHGPTSNWAAHVRLAETPNIFLTTLGACPSGGAWETGSLLQTTLHFLSGEVGAGKLFFASGRASSEPLDGEAVEAWLASLNVLDDDQRRLIRCDNVRELFGA
jgi:hypothetical protein